MLFRGMLSRRQRQEFRSQADDCLGPAYDRIADLEQQVDVLLAFVSEQEERIRQDILRNSRTVWQRMWWEVRRGPEGRRSRSRRKP